MTSTSRVVGLISAAGRLFAQVRLLPLACSIFSLGLQPCEAAILEIEAGPDPPDIVKGLVRDGQGPVSGAIVRLQTTSIFTTTDTAGFFTLSIPQDANSASITAWAPGYYIGGGVELGPQEDHIAIELARHGNEDHRGYEWISAFSSVDQENACQNCHSEPGGPKPGLPFDQWCDDSHAGSVRNLRFLTMYLGTDINGNRSPPTRYHVSRDYGDIPARPHPDRPYYGPGYKLDFPTTDGNCATCHAPLAAVNSPYGVDPTRLTGVNSEGISCDFCHKIWDVILDPATGMPYDNRPGVLSFDFRRPESGHQLFTGPFDDVAPGEDVYSPIQRESQYCAPCHSARFWGTQIYNSYGEWLASPYSRPGSETTCQDCHMPSGLTDHFTRFEDGGRRRDPEMIASHRMPGAGDVELLQDAVTMTADAVLRGDTLLVEVEILNDRTGHHVPSDSPLRQMILLVRATDDQGKVLEQVGGPTLPPWCGEGDPADGYIAGLPGTAYAKILEELWTGVAPTGAYWNQTRIFSDNRIAALDSDLTTYAFESPAGDEAIVEIKLLYRRAFIELRDQKGWDGQDIEMAQVTMTVYEGGRRIADPPEAIMTRRDQ